MTTTLFDEPVTASSPPRHSLPLPAVRALPWLLPAGVGVVGLAAIDVPFGPMLRYAIYFAACVVLPGVLIMRALWRSTGNWAEDIGLGAVVGIGYQLLGWALFTAIGSQRWLVVWPSLVLVLFAAVPRLRAHWRIAAPLPLPAAWSWGVACAAALLLSATIAGVMAYHPVPPDGQEYYLDLLYHLSMVRELMRSVPPELPQVAGVQLDYHWFANADMAAAVDISGSSPAMVLFRLWMVPLVVVAVLVVAILARHVSRVWWTGPLAAVMLVAPKVGHLLNPPPGVELGGMLSYVSPSQTFAVIMGMAAAVFLIEALYRGGGVGVWILAVALALVAGGSKPTMLPILLGGAGLAALSVLTRERKVPWRSALAGALLVASWMFTMLTVAGSTSGSRFQLFGVIKFQGAYVSLTGDESLPATGGWILPPLVSGNLSATTGALVLIVAMLAGEGIKLVGFLLPFARSTRRDPVVWFMIGALIAGWLGLLLVDHPSQSEAYFLRGATPFSIAAATWAVAVAIRGRGRATAAVMALAGLLIGVLVALARMLSNRLVGTAGDDLSLVAAPVLATLVLVVVAMSCWSLISWHRPAVVGLGLIVPVFAMLGLTMTNSVERALNAPGLEVPRIFTSQAWRLSPGEQAAARWLDLNAGPDDVVASNTACRETPGGECDARGYLVSGLAGRRALLEGWAYAQQTMALHGVDGKPYTRQPSPFSDRANLTEELFTRPNVAVSSRLRDQYGVRWIFADSRFGRIGPGLERVAVLRHQEAEVSIYELVSE